MSLYDTKKKGQRESRQQEKDRIKNHGQGNTAVAGKRAGLSFTLSAKQWDEYDRMDEGQQEFFKYFMHDPSADMSKIDMTGKVSQAKPAAASTPDKPTLRPAVNYGETAELKTQESRTKPKTALSGILDSLSPRQRAEYDGMSEDEQNLFRYFVHDPDVEVPKLNIMGSAPKRTQTTSTEVPTLQKVSSNSLSTYPVPDTTETYYQYLIRQAEENPALYSNPNYAQELRRTEQRMEQEQPMPSAVPYSSARANVSGENGSYSAYENPYPLNPAQNGNYADELLDMLLHPGESFANTAKTIDVINSEVKKMEDQIEDVPVDRYDPWTTKKVIQWKTDKNSTDPDQLLNDYKDGWITAYRNVIKKAAEIYDIPPELLACVAWIEVAGDPMWIDSAAYAARKFLPDSFWNRTLSVGPEFYDKYYREPSKTSFGYVSMQLGVAANMIGLEPESLDLYSEMKLASVLSDPKMSIMFAARHLAQLKNIDFPDIPSNDLTLDEMKVIANRYNMGSSLSLETIEQYDYGSRFWDRMDDFKNLW